MLCMMCMHTSHAYSGCAHGMHQLLDAPLWLLDVPLACVLFCSCACSLAIPCALLLLLVAYYHIACSKLAYPTRHILYRHNPGAIQAQPRVRRVPDCNRPRICQPGRLESPTPLLLAMAGITGDGSNREPGDVLPVHPGAAATGPDLALAAN